MCLSLLYYSTYIYSDIRYFESIWFNRMLENWQYIECHDSVSQMYCCGWFLGQQKPYRVHIINYIFPYSLIHLCVAAEWNIHYQILFDRQAEAGQYFPILILDAKCLKLRLVQWHTLAKPPLQVREWIRDHIHNKQWDVTTYPYHTSICSLAKPLWKFRHRCVFTSHITRWM